MYIDNVTLIQGKSHLSTSSKTGGISLKTDAGLKFFKMKQKRYEDAIHYNAKDVYRKFLEEELEDISHDLDFFLEDDEMSKIYNMGDKDEDGWHIFNELADKYNVCKYFIGKLK